MSTSRKLKREQEQAKRKANRKERRQKMLEVGEQLPPRNQIPIGQREAMMLVASMAGWRGTFGRSAPKTMEPNS